MPFILHNLKIRENTTISRSRFVQVAMVGSFSCVPFRLQCLLKRYRPKRVEEEGSLSHRDGVSCCVKQEDETTEQNVA
jgi:hypothetical protein